MNLRKFSDFNDNKEDKVEEVVTNKPTNTEISESKNDDTSEEVVEKEVVKEVTEAVKQPIKEEVLLTPEDKDLPAIEILEERIIKFNSGHINEILETIKSKFSDTDYYIRKKEGQLHIVKYNEELNLNMNEFVNSLLKYYSSNKESQKVLEGIKVKGNQTFSIIENMRSQFINKFVVDITKLLASKK